MPSEAVELQPEPDTSPPLARQPEETFGPAWQVAGVLQVTEALGSVPSPTPPTLDEESTEIQVSETPAEPAEPPSVPEPPPKPKPVPEETSPELEQTPDGLQPEPEPVPEEPTPSLDWAGMMSGYAVTPLEEDEDE